MDSSKNLYKKIMRSQFDSTHDNPDYTHDSPHTTHDYPTQHTIAFSNLALKTKKSLDGERSTEAVSSKIKCTIFRLQNRTGSRQ